MFTVLTEDDGNWFVSQKFSSSSSWLPELCDLLLEAQRWMETNLKPDVHDYHVYGFKF